MKLVLQGKNARKYVKWAKAKLAVLSHLRKDLNLPKMIKTFIPERNFLITVMASEFEDMIRIVASGAIRREVFRGFGPAADEELALRFEADNFVVDTTTVNSAQRISFIRWLKSKGYHRSAAEYAKRYLTWSPGTADFVVPASLSSYWPSNPTHTVSLNNNLVALSEGTDGKLYAWWAGPVVGSSLVPNNAFWNEFQFVYSGANTGVRRRDILPFVAYCMEVQVPATFDPFTIQGSTTPAVIQVPHPNGGTISITVTFFESTIIIASLTEGVEAIDIGSTINGGSVDYVIRLQATGALQPVNPNVIDLRQIVDANTTGFSLDAIGALTYNDGGGDFDTTMSGIYADTVFHGPNNNLVDFVHVACGCIIQADGPLVWGVRIDTDNLPGINLPPSTSWESVIVDEFVARVTPSSATGMVVKETYPSQKTYDHIDNAGTVTQLQTAADFLAESGQHIWTFRQDGGILTGSSGSHTYGLDHVILGRQLQDVITTTSVGTEAELTKLYLDVLNSKVIVVRELSDTNGSFNTKGTDRIYIGGVLQPWVFVNNYTNTQEVTHATRMPNYSDGQPNGGGGYVQDVNGLPNWRSYGPSEFISGVSNIQQLRVHMPRAPGQSLYSEKFNSNVSLHSRTAGTGFGGELAPFSTRGFRSYFTVCIPQSVAADDKIAVIHAKWPAAYYVTMALEDESVPTSEEIFATYRATPSDLPATLYNVDWFSTEWRSAYNEYIDITDQTFMTVEEGDEKDRIKNILVPLNTQYVNTTRSALITALGITNDADSLQAVKDIWDPFRASLFASDDGSWHTIAYSNFPVGDKIIRHVGKSARPIGNASAGTLTENQLRQRTTGLFVFSGDVPEFADIYSFTPPVV